MSKICESSLIDVVVPFFRVVLTESLKSFGQFGIVSLDFAVGLRMTRSGVGMFDRVPFEIDFEFIGEKFRPIVSKNSESLAKCIFDFLDQVDSRFPRSSFERD